MPESDARSVGGCRRKPVLGVWCCIWPFCNDATFPAQDGVRLANQLATRGRRKEGGMRGGGGGWCMGRRGGGGALAHCTAPLPTRPRWHWHSCGSLHLERRLLSVGVHRPRRGYSCLKER